MLIFSINLNKTLLFIYVDSNQTLKLIANRDFSKAVIHDELN